MFRHVIPNQIRQGLGLGTSANDVTIAAGDAIIAGRWAWTDTGDTIDCTGLQPVSPADYYVYWRVEMVSGGPPYADPTEASARDPTDETSRFYVVPVSGYNNSPYEIILGKVSIDNGVPTFAAETDKYTDIPDQWAAGRIVPRTRSSDDQNSYSSVRVAYASGGREIIDQISTESYGARIWNKLQLDDTNGGSSDVLLKNVDGVIMARNAGLSDNDWVPFDGKSYRIDGAEVITNARELTNVTILSNSTINGFTLAGNIISTENRNIQLDNALDRTLRLENTLAGVANFEADGNITAEGQIVSQGSPIAIISGGTGKTNIIDARENLGLELGVDVQTQDAGLQSIANLSPTEDKMIYTTAVNTYAVADLTSYARTLLDDDDEGVARSTLGVVIGADVQAYHVKLQNLVGHSGAQYRIPMYAGANNWTDVLTGAAGRTIMAHAAKLDVRAYLDLEVGSDLQAYDLNLDSLSAVSPAANRLPYFNSSSSMTYTTLTGTGRTLLGYADLPSFRAGSSLYSRIELDDWLQFRTTSNSAWVDLVYIGSNADDAMRFNGSTGRHRQRYASDAYHYYQLGATPYPLADGTSLIIYQVMYAAKGNGSNYIKGSTWMTRDGDSILSSTISSENIGNAGFEEGGPYTPNVNIGTNRDTFMVRIDTEVNSSEALEISYVRAKIYWNN
jgi:hypothetical protein